MNFKMGLLIAVAIISGTINTNQIRKNLNEVIKTNRQQIRIVTALLEQTIHNENFLMALNSRYLLKNNKEEVEKNIETNLTELRILALQQRILFDVKGCMQSKELLRLAEKEFSNTSEYQITDKDIACQCFDNAPKYLHEITTHSNVNYTQEEKDSALNGVKTIRQRLIQ